MADLTFTSIEVLSSVKPEYKISASVAVAIGDIVYQSGTQFIKAVATDLTTLNASGVSLTSASIGEFPQVVPNGARIRLVGATMTKGVVYYLSETAGKIAPLADIVTGGAAIVPVLLAESATEALVILTKPPVDITV